jgi:hypothetical protein
VEGRSATANFVDARSARGRPIQQVILLENGGVTPLAMITQVNYLYRTQPIKETGRINPIFQ